MCAQSDTAVDEAAVATRLLQPTRPPLHSGVRLVRDQAMRINVVADDRRVGDKDSEG